MIVVFTRRLASKDAGMKTRLRQGNKEGRGNISDPDFVILDCLRGVSPQGELCEVKETACDQIADAFYGIFAVFLPYTSQHAHRCDKTISIRLNVNKFLH